MKVYDIYAKRYIIRLNELEYVEHSSEHDNIGVIFANIWYKDEIIAIRESDGIVLDRYDMRHLFPLNIRKKLILDPKKSIEQPLATSVVTGEVPLPETTTPDCLNGIAYNREDNTFIVTGKWWPHYYHIKLRKKNTNINENLI